MGSFQSSLHSTLEHKVQDVKSQVLEFQAKQREMQMAIMIAQTRDMVQYMSGIWTGFASIAILASVVNKGKPPAPMFIPLLVLPLAIGYQADMAYHTKLRRVTKEAEHILENERYRFIPPKQAPFAQLYENEEEKIPGTAWGNATRVGSLWPAPIRDWLEGPSPSN